jgi:AcrR family transcriptional regulator
MAATPEKTAVAPAPSRRARLRAAMTGDIKAIARRQLAEEGPGAVSLRAIARELGTASSALFRYYPSHNDLVTELLVDAYNSLADALAEAVDALPESDPTARWRAIGTAYRSWALANRSEFALTHGTPLPGYEAPPQITGPAAGRALALALREYAAAVDTGDADPGRSQVPADIHAGDLLSALAGPSEATYHPRLVAIILTAHASIVGYLAGEIFGRLTQLVTDTNQLYQAHLRTVMLGMGFTPHALT